MEPNKSISCWGKLGVGVLALLFALTLVASSQELKKTQQPDTSVKKLSKFNSEFSFFRLPIYFHQKPGVLYRPSVSLSPPILWMSSEKIDLVAPWKLELAKQDENRILWTIVGSMELAGVGYIAYQHIKKYGLW